MPLDTYVAKPSSIPNRIFDYRRAFDRNIGWLSEWEQQHLRERTVAIAGLGGVGGAHATTLARLGIGGFHIADLDRFDIVNLNRQAGAFLSTLDREKSDITAQIIRDINPELRLSVFPQGVDERNIDEFLAGVDLFVDGLDFFVIDIRRKVFARCAELGIPAITAAPIGFGSSYLVFMPGGMTFEQYFRFEGLPEERQYVNFAMGLTPKAFHRTYMIDPSRIDLAHRRGPSSAAAIQLCAGIVAAEAVKIMLGRGKVHPAPYYHQFDAYRGKWTRGRLPLGNAGPLQTLKRQIGYRAFASLSRNARPAEEPVRGSELEQILDLARWAPSGDNAQPWRFEVAGEDGVTVHIEVEGEEQNIYDYQNGRPTFLSAGFLLESMRIAATRFGRRAEWTYAGHDGHAHRIEVTLTKDASLAKDPLCEYLAIRSVDRRAYLRRRPLTAAQKAELEAALGDGLRIEWRETRSERLKIARLCARTTDLRLRLPQAYRVHKRILDWNRRFSPDGVPVAAIGLDRLTTALMRGVFRDWSRVEFMNRYLAGTVMPQLQLDLIPGLSCAGYAAVTSPRGLDSDDRVTALLRIGERLQRFWLTATRLGLAMQPALAPLCFAHYGRVQSQGSALPEARKIADRFKEIFPSDPESVVFLTRIGTPKPQPPGARSTRKPVAALHV
jgi:molybdopterin/thiamine biosynthesis adenylyltransferase/nitroreductase